MKNPKYELQISRPRTEGRTLAYIRIQMNFLWVSFRLDRVNGKIFLNPPANFVESLQGRPTSNGGNHSGWINTAGLSADFGEEVKKKAMAELGLEEASS